MRTRDAILPDAVKIHRLISTHYETGTLLPRSLPELCENVRDFKVIEDAGRIVGCGALHLYGIHLAEIRSIAVDPAYQRAGLGALLVKSLMRSARKHHVTGVCLFTRIPEFFSRLGFSIVSREQLPDKLYKDCCECPRFHCCDEVAMLRGEIPSVSIFHPLQPALVKLQA